MPWGLSTGNHAEDSQAALDKPQEMTLKGSARLLKEQPALGEEDVVHSLRAKERLEGDETPTASRRRTVDKKSWDYIVKSGVAGGVAACAVCHIYISPVAGSMYRPDND